VSSLFATAYSFPSVVVHRLARFLLLFEVGAMAAT
jgi:hypothetical protein